MKSLRFCSPEQERSDDALDITPGIAKAKGMACSEDVLELIEDICENDFVPKNVRITLEEIRSLFQCEEVEIGIKIDSALQVIEDISLDPNLSSFARIKIWNLSSVLESIEAK